MQVFVVFWAVFVNAELSSFATTKNLTFQLHRLSDPVSGSVANPSWELFVNDTAEGKRQQVTGFGAAWTDATITAFEWLDPDDQTNVLQELFSKDGIHLSFMRHTIGMSDLTPAWYGPWSFDNTSQPDPNLDQFSLTEHGEKMVDWILRMYQQNPVVKLLGSPWSAPQWMKGKTNEILPQYEDAWVNYMVKYLQAYHAKGIDVTAMTIQNEPLHSSDPEWTTAVPAATAVTLTNKLGPALKAAKLSTEIWAYDHNTDQPAYPSQVLQQAGDFVDTVAWHCYVDKINWTDLAVFRENHPGVKQYMTECWLHLQDEGFFELPDFVTGPMQNYANGALAWTLGGSTKYDVSWPSGCGPCSGLIQVDKASKHYAKTQDYYTLGQFSKFVEQGAFALFGSGSYTYGDGTGVQASQYLNPDGSRVVVIVNKLGDLPRFQITFRGSNQIYHGPVPGLSVTTWIIPG